MIRSFPFTVLLLSLTACVAVAEDSPWDQPTPALAKPQEMTVYRSPTCGCCKKWMSHMEKQGFVLKDVPSEDMEAVKAKLGVPDYLASCHTAVVDGYLVEGHVPAGDVKQLLTGKKTSALGLAVPGMPAGTPGMEMGGKKDKFSVIVFDKQGNADQFHEYAKY
ncbi:MAG: DUF411 domain-containing protein [Methylococcaceae bacterium]|nr:DUF411 domain-containing protein [Methylococcaceae bacterium]